MTMGGLKNLLEDYLKKKDKELLWEMTKHIPKERNIFLAQAVMTARYNRRMFWLTLVIAIFTVFMAINIGISFWQIYKEYQEKFIKFDACYKTCNRLILDEDEKKYLNCQIDCIEKHGVTEDKYNEWFVKENK